MTIGLDGHSPKTKWQTWDEIDFIINYDIKYRMGDELNAGE